MPNYDYECIICLVLEERQVIYEDRDEQFCMKCENPLKRHFPAPMVTRASYPDGHKRKGWAEMREASKLNQEAIVSKSDSHKKQIATEIRDKLKVNISK